MKESLRKFQSELAERLAGAASTVSYNRLKIRSGEHAWLVSLADVEEIVAAMRTTAVPLTHPWYVGVTNIRGNLFSVVDFSAFCGGDITEESDDNRLILVGARFNINAAILVSMVVGLGDPTTMTLLEDNTDQNRVSLPWAGQRWQDTDAQVWDELKVEELVNYPEFLRVGV